MFPNNLPEFLKTEPAYRLKQIKKAIFQDLIEDWQEASVLPLTLRQKLNKLFPLKIKARFTEAKDGTIKALITLNDGEKIETVLLSHRDGRRTVCLSAQVGCPLACRFCATGALGFKRNLAAEEIANQFLLFARYLKKKGEKISNVVFMGMGEPLLNYDEVLSAIKTFNDKESFNLGARRISLSTVGVPGGLKKLAREKEQVNLAISLHAPDNEMRSRLIPFNRHYPIEKIIKEVDYYIAKTRRRVMFEYVLIKGVNDSPACAQKLTGLLKKPLCFVNLISYNSTLNFRPSTKEAEKEFREILEKNKIPVTKRVSFGRLAKAACGQLAAGR